MDTDSDFYPTFVLSESTAAALEAEGLLSPTVNNKRKISTSTISSCSMRDSATPSSSLTAQTPENSRLKFRASSTSFEVKEIEIPERLLSVETYEFIGFEKDIAEKLWSRYVNKPSDMPATFLDFAKAQIDMNDAEDVETRHEDWRNCMTMLGIKPELQNAILLPEFEDVRHTASCKFWCLDAIESTFEGLQHLETTARMGLARLQREKEDPKRRNSQTPTLVAPTNRKRTVYHQALQANQGQESEPSASGKSPSSMLSSKEETSNAESSVVDVPVVTTEMSRSEPFELHMMLWRSATRFKCDEFYAEATKTINLNSNACVPGDFSGDRRLTYFTPQRETADRYATWSKHKYSITEMGIIQVAVPHSLIRTLNVDYLWNEKHQKPEDVWKRVIWYSRRGHELPDDLSYLEDKDVLIGHIASGIDTKYDKLSNFTLIREEDVLKVEIDGEMTKAIQWAFATRKSKRDFGRECRDKVSIHSVGALVVPKNEQN